MTTIDKLTASPAVSADDQLPIWKMSDGVVRRIPISALDDRYSLPDDTRYALYKFVGVSATPPLTRSNGDGLQSGDLYTDTQTPPLTWIFTAGGWAVFMGSLSPADQATINAAVAQAQAFAANAQASAVDASNSAASLDAIVQQLEGSILQFNTFDLGYLDTGTPSGTSIDLGNLS